MTYVLEKKHGNVSKEEYDLHIKLKDEARDEKTKDKEPANDKIYVWTMDMQAVLPCPKSKASSLYYKTKLQVHNFTLYNQKQKRVTATPWTKHREIYLVSCLHTCKVSIFKLYLIPTC